MLFYTSGISKTFPGYAWKAVLVKIFKKSFQILLLPLPFPQSRTAPLVQLHTVVSQQLCKCKYLFPPKKLIPLHVKTFGNILFSFSGWKGIYSCSWQQWISDHFQGRKGMGQESVTSHKNSCQWLPGVSSYVILHSHHELEYKNKSVAECKLSMWFRGSRKPSHLRV